MVTVSMRTDGMAIGISRLIVTVAIDRSSRMRGFEFHGTGRRIDGRDQNEDGDEQRKERRHQSKFAVLLYHSSHVTHDGAESPCPRCDEMTSQIASAPGVNC